MSRFVVVNPGVEEGVDTKCCRRRISEVLTALITTRAGSTVCQLVFDPACGGDRSWTGIANLISRVNGRNGSNQVVSVQLECLRLGWQIRVDATTLESASVEESWPLFLEFASTETKPGQSEWSETTITE